MTTTPDPITTAPFGRVIAEADKIVEGQAARIAELEATIEKLKAENERLTNKVQSQHDHMAPKYDAAMAEIEKLKAERDEAAHSWSLVDPLPTSRGHAYGDWRDIRACLEALVVDYMSLPDHTRDALWKFAEALPKVHPAMTFNCSECGKTFSRVNQYRCADCNATCCENCIRPHFGPNHQPHNATDNAEITRLTSQLHLYKAALAEARDKLFMAMCAEPRSMPALESAISYTLAGLNLAASQWIKDRQAKGEEE